MLSWKMLADGDSFLVPFNWTTVDWLDTAGRNWKFGQVELVPALLSRAVRVAMKESRTAVARAESLEAAAPGCLGALRSFPWHDIPRWSIVQNMYRNSQDFGVSRLEWCRFCFSIILCPTSRQNSEIWRRLWLVSCFEYTKEDYCHYSDTALLKENISVNACHCHKSSIASRRNTLLLINLILTFSHIFGEAEQLYFLSPQVSPQQCSFSQALCCLRLIGKT